MNIPSGEVPNPTYTPTSSRASSVSGSSHASESSSAASSAGSDRPLTEKQKALRQAVGKLAGQTISAIQQVGDEENKVKKLVEIRERFDSELAQIKHTKASFVKRLISDNELANIEVSAQSKRVSQDLVYKALSIANSSVPTELTKTMFSLLDTLEESETAKRPSMFSVINLQSIREIFIPSKISPGAPRIQHALRTVLKETDKLILASQDEGEQQDLKAARDALMSVLEKINNKENTQNIDPAWEQAVRNTLNLFRFEAEMKAEEQ